MEPKLNLEYGEKLDIEAKRAIVTEEVAPLRMEGLPIKVDVANIDTVSNDEYIMLRRTGLGASDVSIVLGVNPYKTVDELIKEKVSTTISEEERMVGQQVAVMKGRDLEPLIMKKWRENFSERILKPSDMYRFIDYPHLTINFDGVVDLEDRYVPCEIKVVTYRGEKHYNLHKAMFIEGYGFNPLPTDASKHNWSIQTKAAHYGIPPYYYTQLQDQIFGLNAPYGYLTVLVEREWKIYTYFVYRDEATISDIIVNGYKVWNKIESLKGGQPI